MDMWINDYDLLNAKESDINAENAPLWSLEYTLLTSEDTFQAPLLEYITKCKTDTQGLYNQFPFEVDGVDTFMSPDQLIGFVGSLAIDGRKQAIRSIWRYLWTHLFTYDNTQPGKINFGRIMQPSAVLFTSIHAGHIWFKPLLSILLIHSCATKKKETSGKLKAWVMFKSLDMKLTDKICSFFIKKNSYLKSWYGVFKEYFQEDGHPIPEVAKSL